MVQKKQQYEELLEKFVDFTQRDEVDPVYRADWLYNEINKSGIFIIDPPPAISKKHATGLYIAIHSMFRSMVGIERVRRRGVVPCTSVKPVPFEIRTICNQETPHLFADLGASGYLGIVFILRFLMEVEGVTSVKICEWCKRFFFPRRSDRKRCYQPRTCDKDFYKSIRGKK